MSLSSVSRNYSQGSYEAERNFLIEGEENLALRDNLLNAPLDAHNDGISVAIGFGYDLPQNVGSLITDLTPHVAAVQHGVTVAQALATVQGLVQTYDITAAPHIAILNDPNATQSARDAALQALNLLRVGLVDDVNAQITLTNIGNARNLLNQEIQAFEANLSAVLGTADDLPESRERAAIVSLIYNLGSANAIPATIDAIRNNDRVRAWFEIRYRSNDNDQVDNIEVGLANRRIEESDLFGLYTSADGTTPLSSNEAKQVARFLSDQAIGK